MKKLYIGLGIAGLAGIGYALYRYFKIQTDLLMNYEYKIIGVGVKKLSLNEVTLDFKMRFFSKSDIEAEIKKVYLEVFLEGVSAGYISENKKFIIPAKGSSDIDLQYSFNPQTALGGIVQIIAGGLKKKDIAFRIKGYVDVKSGFVSTAVPVDYSSTIKNYLSS